MFTSGLKWNTKAALAKITSCVKQENNGKKLSMLQYSAYIIAAFVGIFLGKELISLPSLTVITMSWLLGETGIHTQLEGQPTWHQEVKKEKRREKKSNNNNNDDDNDN